MSEFVPTPNPDQPDDPFLLKGRVALVVGVGDPLGRAAAVALAEAGADVAVATLRAGPQEVVRVNSVANEIWSLGRGNTAITLDASNENSVDAAIARTTSELGRLDILVNAADLPVAAPLDELSPEDWHAILAANLLAPALTSRAAARVMKTNGYGRIINLVSVLAARGVANTSAYAAAHAGVLALSRSLSQEWARSGITVNALQVGIYEGQRGFGDDPESVRQVARMLPAKQLVQPERCRPRSRGAGCRLRIHHGRDHRRRRSRHRPSVSRRFATLELPEGRRQPWATTMKIRTSTNETGRTSCRLAAASATGNRWNLPSWSHCCIWSIGVHSSKVATP